MPHLEAFNIRNLPAISGSVAMPMDDFVKGLAAMFIDVTDKEKRLCPVGTIALGAPFYRDIDIGTSHVEDTELSDYLRFRVYDVDYNHPSGGPPILCEIVKGAAETSEEQFPYDDLLYSYWFG